MKKILRYLLTTIVLVAISSTPIHAATTSSGISPLSYGTLNFYNRNGIYYYNANGGDYCVIGTGSYDGSTSAGLTSVQAGFVDTYHDIAIQLSVEYGIPWEAVMAQGILESAAGTSRFAIERNNFFGLGAVDSNPGAAYYYPTPMAGWRGYYDFIKNNSRYRNHGVFKEPTVTNPYAYLQAIKNAGYATDPNYVSKVSGFITAVINRAKEKGWPTSSELATRYPEMLENAAANASGIGNGGGPSDTSYTGTTCVSNPGGDDGSDDGGVKPGNGSINSSALTLAWPGPGHSKDDPRPTYKNALQTYGMWVDQNDNCSVNHGASCDRFVSAVILYSGVDSNFPKNSNANSILSYLSSSNLYKEVTNISNTSDLQPGDILAKSSSGQTRGHVQIYVQKGDGSFGIASASYCDRTGEITGTYGSMLSGYRIFRFVGQSV